MGKDYKPVRKDIAAVKVAMAEVNESIVSRAQRVHGGLGFTWELPLAGWHQNGQMLYVGDGPIELHMMTVVKQILGKYPLPKDDFEVKFTCHNLLKKREAALERCVPMLRRAGIDPSCVTSA